MLSRWHHPSQALLLLGGVVLPILWDASKKTEFACGNCGATFGVRGFVAKLSLCLLWSIACLVVLGIGLASR